VLAAAGRDEASVGNYVLSYVVHVCASFLVYLSFLVSWFSWLPLASSGVSDFLWLVLGLLLDIWAISFNCLLKCLFPVYSTTQVWWAVRRRC